MKERFVLKRFVNIILLLLVTVIYTVLLCYKEQLWLDQLLCFLAIDIIFFVLFVFALEYNRRKKRFASNSKTTYKRIVIGYVQASLMAVLCSYFPEFTKPVIMIPILMLASGPQEIAVITSLFFCAVLAIVTGMSSLELISCVIMILFACVLSGVFENKKIRIWNACVILCLSVITPAVFYYLHHQEFSYKIMIWGAAEGVVMGLFLIFCYERLTIIRDTETEALLIDMQEEDYPLAEELKKFSQKEFLHAKRVSEISKKCARIVNADKQVCGAAALYYRIGILEGNEIAANGVRIANKYCFPDKVVEIISEYQGFKQRPTSIESAIVQMVDGLIKKLEVLDQTTMSSTWNQDMVIYQTLNEFSTEGMYDQSGLSMNMFLKIREYLVKEEKLIEEEKPEEDEEDDDDLYYW